MTAVEKIAVGFMLIFILTLIGIGVFFELREHAREVFLDDGTRCVTYRDSVVCDWEGVCDGHGKVE